LFWKGLGLKKDFRSEIKAKAGVEQVTSKKRTIEKWH
jgi:hypothetical protein